MKTAPDSPPPPHHPSLREALGAWVYIGVNSFGGPAGQIAVMHRVLVEERRWISEARFLHALNYCMLLPGPEAQQLATYCGWLLHGTRGGLMAGLLFILPGFLSILGLSYVYVLWQEAPLVEGLFFGIKAAILAIVLEAVARIGKRALRTPFHRLLALAAFVAIFMFAVPFPLIVLCAALAGLLAQSHPALRAAPDATTNLDDTLDPVSRPPARGRAAAVVAVCGALWTLPLMGLWLLGDAGRLHLDIGVFFSKAAVVTFGGAYAVLAYIGQQAVETHGWLQPGQMIDGLALAETTPGPLIMVVQFVGFLAAHGQPGGLPPLAAATLGAVVTTWVTFVPCFLWIFLGAPYVEALRGNRWLGAALGGITAAVVGVVMNLGVWFALHTLFGEVSRVPWWGLHLWIPDPATLRPVAVVIAAGAMVATFRHHIGMLRVLGACAGLGLLATWLGLTG